MIDIDITKYITTLKSAIVVDNSRVKGLGAEPMAYVMREAYGNPNFKVIFVENAGLFFQPKNLINMLKDGNPLWPLVAEKLGVTVSDDAIKAISTGQYVLNQIIERAKGIKSTYEFVEPPLGWRVEFNLVINKTHIRRHGPNDHHTIGIKAAQNIWNHARKLWSGEVDSVPTIYVNASGYRDRQVNVGDKVVQVGCQNIHRYELEQLALHLGWEFP